MTDSLLSKVVKAHDQDTSLILVCSYIDLSVSTSNLTMFLHELVYAYFLNTIRNTRFVLTSDAVKVGSANTM